MASYRTSEADSYIIEEESHQQDNKDEEADDKAVRTWGWRRCHLPDEQALYAWTDWGRSKIAGRKSGVTSHDVPQHVQSEFESSHDVSSKAAR